MIYVSNRFKKQYNRLAENYKVDIQNIIDTFNKVSYDERFQCLKPWLGDNGNSKWNGISKTLYHLYPQKNRTEHRLFYCYTSDIDEKTREICQMIDGLVLIDYTTNHDEANNAAKNYNNGKVKNYSRLEIQFVDELDIINNQTSLPMFFFCLTKEQNDLLKLNQPLLVKGSAGTGKTIISFELFKHWVTNSTNSRLLYLTYTDNLLEKAVITLEEDGVDLKNEANYYQCIKLTSLLTNKNNLKIVSEKESRDIIIHILEDFKKVNRIPINIIFSDYFIYSYIRGIIKGRSSCIQKWSLDFQKYDENFQELIDNVEYLNVKEIDKIKRILKQYLEDNEINEKIFDQKIKLEIVSSLDNKNEKKLFGDKLLSLITIPNFFSVLNSCRKCTKYYDFINKDDAIKLLRDDGLDDSNIKLIFEINDLYNRELFYKKWIDDNDCALKLLNQEICEDKKYDGIIVDEVQDFTEIQIESIVNYSKNESSNISFFGDPNQTINPTVYNYGRFNSFVYSKTIKINRCNLKITHRCGPNLLEYINHLAFLREKFKLTLDREDLERETSAINKDDTYWACLVEERNMIEKILENFIRAEDCFLIVDNENTKEIVMNKILKLFDADKEYLEDQIITVQNAKGLESKNVIIYNLISDNIEIFKNLVCENNKIASMTFNKLYVSCTRAEDSVIICEELLMNEVELKKNLFYSENIQITEEITEEDIELYLSLSIDPTVFYSQAEALLERHNYLSADKKINIALKNIINQFQDDEFYDENLLFITEQVGISNIQVIKQIDEMNKYCDLYDEILQKYGNLLNLDRNLLEKLLERKKILIQSLRIKKICKYRIEFEEYKDFEDYEIQYEFLENFILLEDYDCCIYVIKHFKKIDLKKDLEKIVKYIFGYEDFKTALDALKNANFHNENIFKRILDKQLFKDAKYNIEQFINNIRRNN